MLRAPRPASFIAHARRVWRRSLQVRVVTITLVTSGVLVLTFGFVVGASITDGLIAAKTRTAEQTVNASTVLAQERLRVAITSPEDRFATPALQDIVTQLENRDRVRVAILPDGPRSSALVAPEGQPAVPTEFRDAVREGGYQSQRVDLPIDGTEQLYLLFGRQVELAWGDVQVFYFFPVQDVIDQANLVANTLAVTGITLVLLLGLVVYVVTRMVVRPVRVAARTAQRLSNGLLDQRMEVAGEDDLAALAASFNQMAENLQRHILRLEDMSRLQRRFTSDVSHELRTPLTTVRMAADLIFNTRDEFDPAVARSAELLQAELDRFENLLAELLEISRFDAGFAALDAEPANLGPLVRRVVDRLGPLAERAGVAVEMDIPAEPVVAEVDVRRVERILRNLIGNAIEHGEGRPVKVRLAAREGAVAVTVRDHGVGLKPGDEKLVFNRFWRSDPSRARQTGGTGLGLSISVEDARLHGGWLEAWGAPGQGAQFRLTVPSRAGDRLASSPLRLVPTDFRPPTDAEPQPASAHHARPLVEVVASPSDPDEAAEPAGVGDGGRSDA
jgi:two-component system sensor histidine kinase MtrB